MNLCEQASKEQDPRKLSILIAEILRLTGDKQNRLDRAVEVKAGSIVVRDGIIGAFKVESISADRKTADIRQFHVSTLAPHGTMCRAVPINELVVFREDRS